MEKHLTDMGNLPNMFRVSIVLALLFFPLIFQGIFDTVFGDLFNPSGKSILLFHLWVMSTLLCFLLSTLLLFTF